ncbi:MAG: HAMP domain-containing histidine kinase [bacterium]|nr:HAMP domain-containing histidine kinase [bacterium]
MLELFGGLADKNHRSTASKKIAKALNAEEFMIFIKDIELNILLPASGFPQTLENSSLWQVFLQKCITQKICLDSDSFLKKMLAISYKDECVFVFIGGSPAIQMVESIFPIMPLIATLLKYEQFELQTKAQLLLTNKTMVELQGIEKKLNTTRFELQAALTETESEIIERKRAEKQKDDFIGIATHELKTPVTSLKAYAEVLQKKFTRAGDIVSAGNLSKMNIQLDKLTHLIEDLLDSTKIDSGYLYMHKELFDFDELVSEIIEEMQRITEKHLLVSEGKSNKKILADKERIGQVITNLISNAIKYSPHADKIYIMSRSTSKDITLCVKDFGIGISKEQQSHVFERFYRATGPKQDTFPGLGLGLYISSEIIKRESGRIWVESINGKGSTFCFTLPSEKDDQI